MTNSFLHAGTFGDTIYSLNVVKILDGGDFFIEENGMNKIAYNAWRAPDAGIHSGRYTKKDIEFMWPLFETQSYIKNLKVWKNEQVNYDLRNHHKFVADLINGPKTGKFENWQGNQTQCYAMVCKLDVNKYRKELLLEPWLTVDSSIKIQNKPIVINKTPRYIKKYSDKTITNEQWKSWIENDSLEDMAVFVGSEEEHHTFCELYKCNVQYYPVSDMLELAKIIQGCEQFIGNQSMALSLAIGLGKTFWCEIRLDYETLKTPYGYGDVWFPRTNGHYF